MGLAAPLSLPAIPWPQRFARPGRYRSSAPRDRPCSQNCSASVASAVVPRPSATRRVDYPGDADSNVPFAAACAGLALVERDAVRGNANNCLVLVPAGVLQDAGQWDPVHLHVEVLGITPKPL